jgi:hypothetical protein
LAKYRTLVRIVGVGAFYLEVVVPAWNPNRIITIGRTSELAELNVTQRVYARVDLSATLEKDLDFSDWEI